MRMPSEQPAYGFLLDAIWTARSTGELERFRALALAHYAGETRQTLVQLIDDRAHRLPRESSLPFSPSIATRRMNVVSAKSRSRTSIASASGSTSPLGA